MNSRLMPSLLTLAGAATLALTAALLSLDPQIAEARPPCGEPYNCICPTGPDFQTPMVWGKATTCADAFQDAVNQTRALMNCEHGVCSETFVVTTGCWFNGTQQQVDGYSLYRCYDCMVDPCEEEIPVL